MLARDRAVVKDELTRRVRPDRGRVLERDLAALVDARHDDELERHAALALRTSALRSSCLDGLVDALVHTTA
jgi:hypothetical protein